jgi:hypothetical protein
MQVVTVVFWPAWTWIDHPESRWLFSSYREPLAPRGSLKCRRLIESDWYQELWRDRHLEGWSVPSASARLTSRGA